MNKKLNEQLTAVAHEYARLFGGVIDAELEYFVGNDPTDAACFGDCYFFSLGEMRDVVDNLPKYIKRYGSKDAVGQEIRDWYDWWLYPNGSCTDMADIRELVLGRITHSVRVNISLKQWLDGCPRQERKPWSSPDADLLRLEQSRQLVDKLISEYGPDNDLANVLIDLDHDLDKAKEEKARRDFDEWQRMMKTKAGQTFKKTIKEITT